MSPHAILAVLVLASALPSAAAAPDGDLRNWFGDPFFQITSDLPDCPLPAGPFVDASDRVVQAHHRAEKGTTCWLAGECDRPNAYAYDQDIAASLRTALLARSPFSGTSLWVTVQGRVVYVEGCAAEEAVAAAAEAFMRALPHVQQAIAFVRTDPLAPPPYKLR